MIPGRCRDTAGYSDPAAPAPCGYDESLKRYGVDILIYPRRMLSEVDWDTGARVLTDQYAPANLLRAP